MIVIDQIPKRNVGSEIVAACYLVAHFWKTCTLTKAFDEKASLNGFQCLQVGDDVADTVHMSFWVHLFQPSLLKHFDVLTRRTNSDLEQASNAGRRNDGRDR
jgi:hypothetical protein